MASATVKALAFAVCAAVVSGNQVNHQAQLRHSAKHNRDSFVTSLDFKYLLRICNAYPNSVSMDVYKGASERLTGNEPLKYKSCRDFKAPLKSGDRLEFRIGEASAGTFSIADLPNNDATLLLVVERHDTQGTSIAFESHVFAATEGSQVAVIDTYKGKDKSGPRIMDEPVVKDGKTLPVRSEELRYDSVVAVSPGSYQVALTGADGKEVARAPLRAEKYQSYVVLRTGDEPKQELVVYPSPSDLGPAKSGAAARQPLAVLLAAALALLMTWGR